MPDKALTREQQRSDDFDKLISRKGGYTLGVGYCYMEQVKPAFERNKQRYFQFQIKWGRCGTTYLFSALRPDNVFMLTAWANASVVCKSTDTLFCLWSDILTNLQTLSVPIFIYEAPAAWKRSNVWHDLGEEAFQTHYAERKQSYYCSVIEPVLQQKNVEYFDLNRWVSPDSSLICENTKIPEVIKIDSPWHLRNTLTDALAQHFIDTIRGHAPCLETLVEGLSCD